MKRIFLIVSLLLTFSLNTFFGGIIGLVGEKLKRAGEWLIDRESRKNSQENENNTPLSTETPASNNKNEKDPPPKNDPSCVFEYEQLGAFALSEWRNMGAIGSFVSDTTRHIMKDNFCFVHFDSVNDVTTWGSPFGFYSRYRTSVGKNKEIDINQKNFGLGLGLEATAFDNFIIGGGLGYFYSHIRWEKYEGSGHTHSLFFGPSVTYLLPSGLINFSLINVGNFYGGELEYCEKQTISLDHSSWNINAHLEGMLDFEVPEEIMPNLSFHPDLQLDYLNVFEKSIEEAKSRYISFLRSLLSFSLSKAIQCTNENLLKSLISMGWTLWVPLNQNPIKANGQSYVVKSESKNQYYIGAKLLFLNRRGLLYSLSYEAFLGGKSPFQLGKIKVEWNW